MNRLRRNLMALACAGLLFAAPCTLPPGTLGSLGGVRSALNCPELAVCEPCDNTLGDSLGGALADYIDNAIEGDD